MVSRQNLLGFSFVFLSGLSCSALADGGPNLAPAELPICHPGTVIEIKTTAAGFGVVKSQTTYTAVTNGQVDYITKELTAQGDKHHHERTGHSNMLIISAEGEDTGVDAEGGKESIRTTYKTGTPADLFPMSVGKSASWTYEHALVKRGQVQVTTSTESACLVSGTETITVPAGTYDTYVIECQHSPDNVKEKVWYAPSVGTEVKGVLHYANDQIDVDELVKYKEASAK